MVVVSLSDCPLQVRGDLSKWLMEISTGVYAGNINAKVRVNLWKRICENLKHGRAVMVWNSNNEQKMEFAVHNALWEPRDFDGITLMWHPSAKRLERRRIAEQADQERKSKIPNAEKLLFARKMNQAMIARPHDYVVIDVETTGFSAIKDELIEVAAVRVCQGKVVGEYSALINPQRKLAGEVEDLTGITNDMLQEEGRSLKEVMVEYMAFIGTLPIVGHNPSFDLGFIERACIKCGLSAPKKAAFDTLREARRTIQGVRNYKLATLAHHFGIDATGAHRALKDCYMTFYLLLKLWEQKDNEGE